MMTGVPAMRRGPGAVLASVSMVRREQRHADRGRLCALITVCGAGLHALFLLAG